MDKKLLLLLGIAFITQATTSLIGGAVLYNPFVTEGNITATMDSFAENAASIYAGGIAMIPFGLGAILFYYLLMKSEIIPKWLAIWGLVTVPFVLAGIPLTVFGIAVPFAVFVPYVPWEFFTGAYIIIRHRSIEILLR